MAVHDGLHVRPRTVNGGVDEAFEVGLAVARFERIAVEIVGEDIFCENLLSLKQFELNVGSRWPGCCPCSRSSSSVLVGVASPNPTADAGIQAC